jgi:serine/threonine-protein kinase
MNGLQPQDNLQPTLAYPSAVEDPGTRAGSAEFTACQISAEAVVSPDKGDLGRFGPYRLKERLGAGGMGEVYEAEHTLLKRPCAIKFIRPDRDAEGVALARFEQEVRATARLTHWNTVEIYDYGHTGDGTFYYVMELLPGMNLGELVQQCGPLPPERAVHFLRQVCSALREAHAVGLVHRDVTPANIFAAKRGGLHDVAKLLDFGLVRQLNSEESETPNTVHKGHFSGAPLYMSPEQATAYDDADPRSDIYSLGAVAYYLLTGTPPFSGRTLLQVLAAHEREEVAAPSTLRTGIPGDLEGIVLRCLQKSPSDRFQDVQTLGRSLGRCDCANKWTEERAATWWRQIEVREAGVAWVDAPETVLEHALRQSDRADHS